MKMLRHDDKIGTYQLCVIRYQLLWVQSQSVIHWYATQILTDIKGYFISYPRIYSLPFWSTSYYWLAPIALVACCLIGLSLFLVNC